jgi:Cu/Ag efflux protein CusF
MKTWLALLGALVVAGALIGVTATMAQTQAPAPSSPAPAAPATPAAPAGMEKSIEGKIKSLDAAGKMLTLQDGTKLTIPSGVKLTRTELKPGASVKVAYEEKGGEKVVTQIEVQK